MKQLYGKAGMNNLQPIKSASLSNYIDSIQLVKFEGTEGLYKPISYQGRKSTAKANYLKINEEQYAIF